MQRTITTENLEHPSNLIEPAIMDTQKMTGLGPLFYKLPTELRLMIFGDCIALGHPDFMRASRALHKDGEAIISKRGIYRMHLGYPFIHYGQYHNQETAEKVQNLDVTVNMMEWWGYAGLLELIMEFPIRREHFNLILKVVCVSHLVDGIELLRPVCRFAGFKRVGLRIEIIKIKDVRHQISCSCTKNRDTCPCTPQLERRDDEWMRNFLLLRLGKAEVAKLKSSFCITLDRKDQARATAGGFKG